MIRKRHIVEVVPVSELEKKGQSMRTSQNLLRQGTGKGLHTAGVSLMALMNHCAMVDFEVWMNWTANCLSILMCQLPVSF